MTSRHVKVMQQSAAVSAGARAAQRGDRGILRGIFGR